MTDSTAVNAVRLVGTIGKTVPKMNMVQVLTKAVSRGREYVTSHAVKVSEFDENLLVEGKKIDVFGELGQHKKRTIVIASAIKKAPKNATFVNVAKVAGPTARAYEYFPPNSGKRAFGNLLVRMGQMFARVVVFNHKARTFEGKCPMGSDVEAMGRLNYRENELPDPETSELRKIQLAEIIADPDQTRLLRAATPEDPFAGTPAESAAPETTKADQTGDDGIPF